MGGSPIGKQAGPRLRRCGAAHTMVRAAPVRATAARQLSQPLLLLIAMRASPIGSLAGASRRRRGAARTQERAAHSKAEVVLEDHSSAVDRVQDMAEALALMRHLPVLVGHALWGHVQFVVHWRAWTDCCAGVLACHLLVHRQPRSP